MLNIMTLRVLSATLFILQCASALPALNSSIETYHFPEGLDRAHSYGIQVKQSTGGVHTVESYSAIVSEANTTSGKGIEHNTSFALFDFEGSADLIVTYNNGPVKSAVIRPYSYGIKPTVKGNTVSFSLDRPRNVVLQVNNDIFDTLQLFTNAIETDIPSQRDPNVVYFGPGIDNGPSSKNGTLVIPSGKAVYLAPGAVVTSRLAFQNATSGSIQGRGVINPRSSGGILIEWSSNILVKDILILGAKGSQSRRVHQRISPCQGFDRCLPPVMVMGLTSSAARMCLSMECFYGTPMIISHFTSTAGTTTGIRRILPCRIHPSGRIGRTP